MRMRTLWLAIALVLTALPARAAVKRFVSLVSRDEKDHWLHPGVRNVTFATGRELNAEARTDRFKPRLVYASIPADSGEVTIVALEHFELEGAEPFGAADFKRLFRVSSRSGVELRPHRGRLWMIAAQLDGKWIDPGVED